MDFINVPNIPIKRVELVLVDGRIDRHLDESFRINSISVIKTEPYIGLYDAISYHPDIVFHHIGDNKIICAPATSDNILKTMKDFGFNVIRGRHELRTKYPGNIHYNVARVGNIAFHNTKYTDSVLRENLDKFGVELVHVNQGYAKCAVSVVDHNSIITMDKGIAKVAEIKGLDVLLVEENNILLPGLDKGFIGGSTCLIDNKKWAITGNIEMLESVYQIYDFLSKKGIEIVCLSKGRVIDIGSIIPLMTI